MTSHFQKTSVTPRSLLPYSPLLLCGYMSSECPSILLIFFHHFFVKSLDRSTVSDTPFVLCNKKPNSSSYKG